MRGGGEATRTLSNDDASLVGKVGHRVGTGDRFVDLRVKVPEVELVPIAPILLLDVEVCIVELMGRALDLDVAGGAKWHLFALR